MNRRPLPRFSAKLNLTGFFMTAPEIRHSPRGVSKPVICLLSGARRHTCLDYYPTEGLGTKQYMAFAAIKTLHEPSTKYLRAKPKPQPKPASRLIFRTDSPKVSLSQDETMHCSILEGHLSTSLCHLANISYRLGRSLRFNGAQENFVNDREADAMLTRVYRKPFVVTEVI